MATTYTIESHNLDGQGRSPTRVYAVPPVYHDWFGQRAAAPTVTDDDLYLRDGESIPDYRARMQASRPPSTRQRPHSPAVHLDYWAAVTDIPCPICSVGTIRWAEAGYVPGYRICDSCGRHFQAEGTAAAPVLLRVGSRRNRVESRARREASGRA